MNPTRLFVLGALARRGPLYGHQIRRDARVDRTEVWSDVRPGSLYGALHRMAAEGLIEVVRTEQEGNLPARTVYAITGEGRTEFDVLRAEAFRQVGLRPDPVDLALAMADDLREDELEGSIQDRIGALGAQRLALHHERERSWAQESTTEALILDHSLARVDAELAWHHQVLSWLPKLVRHEPRKAGTAGLDAAGRDTPAGVPQADR